MRILVRTATTLIAAALMIAGCGTPGSPLPPSLQLPRPVEDLAVVRVGERLDISFRLPEETTDRQGLKRLGTVALQHCSHRNATACEAIHVWNSGTLKPGSPVTISAPLSKDNYIAVSVHNDRGHSAGYSNVVYVPNGAAWPNAKSVSARSSADAVVITIDRGILPSSPSSDITHFYQIFRTQPGQKQPQKIGEVTADDDIFRDTHFDWQQHYSYEVDTVNRLTGPEDVAFEFKSGAAVTTSIETIDVFPPQPPAGLAAIFNGTEPGTLSIDLNWSPNTEQDLAGYNVYRSANGGAPGKLNRELIKTPSYRDVTVAAGAAYSYQVTAVDLRGNESERSTPATERVPQLP